MINSVVSAQLTPEQNSAIIDYMVNTDAYRKQLIDGMVKDPNSAWMNNLSPEKQKKMLKITLEASSKGNILNPQIMTQEDGQKLVEQYM